MLLGGAATNINTQTATWTMDLCQYTFNSSSAALKVHSHIPDAPRFRNRAKPVPSDLQHITFGGVLRDLRRNGDGAVAAVDVHGDHIRFHGRLPTILPSSSGKSVEFEVQKHSLNDIVCYSQDPKLRDPHSEQGQDRKTPRNEVA